MVDTETHFKALFAFLGLPEELVSANLGFSAHSGRAVDEACMSVRAHTPKIEYPVGKISCAMQTKLQAFYKPWNELLHETLEARQGSGVAAPSEPKFLPFMDPPECAEEEEPKDCSDWLATIGNAPGSGAEPSPLPSPSVS